MRQHQQVNTKSAASQRLTPWLSPSGIEYAAHRTGGRIVSRQSTFTAGNIVAILNAAADVGTVRDQYLNGPARNVGALTTSDVLGDHSAQRQENWSIECTGQI